MRKNLQDWLEKPTSISDMLLKENWPEIQAN
jgi:hypothetical protein